MRENILEPLLYTDIREGLERGKHAARALQDRLREADTDVRFEVKTAGTETLEQRAQRDKISEVQACLKQGLPALERIIAIIDVEMKAAYKPRGDGVDQ